MKFTSLNLIEKGFSKETSYSFNPFSIPVPHEDIKLNGFLCVPKKRAEYFHNSEHPKERILLHFTAGNLSSDIETLTQNQHHVSVPFVIARDGTIYQLFSSKFWSGNIGKGLGNDGTGNAQDKCTIAIEISNYGYLTKRGDNLETIYSREKDKSGKVGPVDVYCSLSQTEAYKHLTTAFRSQSYYATFTNEQYDSLIILLRYLTKQYNIPKEFLPETTRYQTTDDVLNFKGIVSHVNYRISDKWDIGPAFDWKKVIDGLKAQNYLPLKSNLESFEETNELDQKPLQSELEFEKLLPKPIDKSLEDEDYQELIKSYEVDRLNKIEQEIITVDPEGKSMLKLGSLILQIQSNNNESLNTNNVIEDVAKKIAELQNLEVIGDNNAWDLAHKAKEKISEVQYAEPNVDNVYVFESKTFDDTLESAIDVCHRNNEYEKEWPFPQDENKRPINRIWHLEDDFSQLKSARDSITNITNVVRIAHVDTGYDPAQIVYDDNLIRHDLERNFVEDELPNRAVDNYTKGILSNPGHGVGTLSLLAGKSVKLPDYNFNDSIGLSKGIQIVPIRISKRVELFKSANFIKAVDHVISLYDNPETRCHIITMSMGGLASKAWADVVNRAYDKGIFIVTAAGNNIGRLTPRTLIYPARFKRVVAACGVTYDYSPYYKPFTLGDIEIMQGNFGPRKVMRTAIATFTPNVPWAKIGCGDVVSLAGAGTSSATPQIASAAALYYQQYFTEIDTLPEGWMKVEAVRYALFNSTSKKINSSDHDRELYFGAGVLQAKKMLEILPEKTILIKEEEDRVSWPLFKLLSDISFNETLVLSDVELNEMYETETMQLIQKSSELQELLDHEEKNIETLSEREKKVFLNIILNMKEASEALKSLLKRAI